MKVFIVVAVRTGESGTLSVDVLRVFLDASPAQSFMQTLNDGEGDAYVFVCESEVQV